MTGPIPCFVVTGALGAGKTTVIRALLEEPGMAGTALIVNEFGEVGLDHLLVSSAVETTLLMENGCMCCSLRGDVVDTVLSLFGAVERGEMPPFRRIVIETTGLADPIPIVRDLAEARVLADKVRSAGVVTCVDGVIAGVELRSNPVAVDQVAQADICLVTKTDLADPLAIDDLCMALTAINPMTRILRVREGRIPPLADIFDEDAVHLPPPEEQDHEHGHGHDHGHNHEHGHENHHDHADAGPHAGVESWSVLLDRPCAWSTVRDWLDLVYSLQAARMLRAKGLIWIEEDDRPLLMQAVGPIVSPLRFLEAWPDGRRETRLVLIAKNLSAATLEESFRKHVEACPTRSS